MALFGGYGALCSSFLSAFFSRYSRQSARASKLLFPGQLHCECWERLSVSLHMALGRQLVRVVVRCWDAPEEEAGREGARPAVGLSRVGVRWVGRVGEAVVFFSLL